MAKYDYNLIVIGAGAAGLVSSYIAAATKAKVALIERHKMGGDCLNTGCVPSKALIKAAKTAHQMKHAHALGIDADNIRVDFAKVMAHVHNAIKTIEPHDSTERYEGLGVECFSGEANLTGPNSVSLNGKTLTARAIIIATGAKPFVPNIPGKDTVSLYTSDTLWSLTELPKRLLIAGGGPIGLELAQAFSRLGSHVTVVERNERIMMKEDPDVSAVVKKRLEDDGIDIKTRCELASFSNQNGQQYATLIAHDGQERMVEFDATLMALGRQANADTCNMDKLGITLRANGTVEANEFLQTNVPSVYVCGDITGPYQFTHVAAHQAWYASVNALFAPFKRFKVDYSVIPWVTYTDPEVARVGLSETDAKAQNIPFEVTRYDLHDLDRAITDANTTGFVKVLTPPNKDTILGVSIVGEHAGDMLPECVLAMRHKLSLGKILGTIHPYPTLAEANKYVAGNWRKNHLPTRALAVLERFQRWRR